jgi:hypothetical protein
MALSSMKGGTPGKKLHPQIEEKINYILSPIYKKRLLEMGEPEDKVMKLIQDRVNVLRNTELRPYQGNGMDWTGGGSASVDLKTNRPYLAYDSSKPNSDSVFAHELGHLTSGVDPNTLGLAAYYPGSEYRSIVDSRKELANVIGTGGSMYMSPAEKYFIDLQNKQSNELPRKGFLLDKWHKGRSINDWFYNQPNEEKYSTSNWPAGTHVSLYPSTSVLEDPSTSIASGTKKPTSVLNIVKSMKKNPNFAFDLVNSPAYKEEFFKNIHDYSPITGYGNGIPNKQYARSLLDVMNGAYDAHDYGAGENKADLDAVRFVLKKNGYTQNYGDNITPELWQKALQDKRVNQDEHIKRMRKNFDDKSIINLNNRVAYNEMPTQFNPLQSMRNNINNV